jgi:hypothetical protein
VDFSYEPEFNITPFVGVAKAFIEHDDPTSLDIVSSGAGSVTVVTEVWSRKLDNDAKDRLKKLQKYNLSRGEQRRI